MRKKQDWFKQKKVTACFAIIALAAGFLFLNRSITGNIISTGHSYNPVSLIGLLLIMCSIILGAYSLKKR